MNLVKKIEQYNDKCIYFCEPIKNNVMNDGNFIRIIYSTENITLNGIYLQVNFNDLVCEKYYNKYRCGFSITTHKDVIDNIKTIEENILKKYVNFDEQIHKSFIKM